MDHLVERLVAPRESDRADAETSAPFDRNDLPQTFQPVDMLTVKPRARAAALTLDVVN